MSKRKYPRLGEVWEQKSGHTVFMGQSANKPKGVDYYNDCIEGYNPGGLHYDSVSCALVRQVVWPPVTPVTPKLNVCQEADQIAGQGGERMRDYGHPLDNHARIAAGWSVLLGTTVTPSQAALCIMWLKLAREMNTYKRDNMVDLCGYAKCYEMIKDEEAKRAGQTVLTGTHPNPSIAAGVVTPVKLNMESTVLERLTSTKEGRREFQQEQAILNVTEAICEIMDAKHVTRTALAQRIGKTKGYVTQLLDGRTNMTIRTISDVLTALDADIDVPATPSRKLVEKFLADVVCVEPSEKVKP